MLRPMIGSVAGLAVAALLIAGPLWGQEAGRTGDEPVTPDEYFDLDIPLIDGGTLSSADLRGKILVVDVWGTWSGPCRRLIPHLIDIQQRFGSRGVEVVGISAEVSGDYETAVRRIEKYAAETGINYHLGILSPEIYDKIRRIMKFEGDTFTIPSTFVVDRSGRIIARYPGYFFGQEREIGEMVADQVRSEPRPSGGSR
jgi:thiol-disulfide isomerase/thioredoxin